MKNNVKATVNVCKCHRIEDVLTYTEEIHLPLHKMGWQTKRPGGHDLTYFLQSFEIQLPLYLCILNHIADAEHYEEHILTFA